MIKIAIIEDEPAIRNEMTWLVQQEKDTILLGWSDNVQDAIRLIENECPDVVLMDIQLIDGSAFDILNTLKTVPENIIFITAYNQFAIRAIKFGALDYLLKPIVQDELKEALERYRNKKGKTTQWTQQLSIAQQTLNNETLPETIALHSLNKINIVLIRDIVYCKGDGPYTFFYFSDNSKLLVSKPLKYYEELLPAPNFLRTHQSYLVNKKHVDRISKSEYLILKNKEEIPISSRRKNYILNVLSSL